MNKKLEDCVGDCEVLENTFYWKGFGGYYATCVGCHSTHKIDYRKYEHYKNGVYELKEVEQGDFQS